MIDWVRALLASFLSNISPYFMFLFHRLLFLARLFSSFLMKDQIGLHGGMLFMINLATLSACPISVCVSLECRPRVVYAILIGRPMILFFDFDYDTDGFGFGCTLTATFFIRLHR